MPKLKKFCKITRYIEQIDGELSQMISDLCLDRLFIPRGVNGITFLYPKDPAYRKEILSSAYSDNPEKAIQMLESLIVLDYLPRPGDFVLKKDDIPNSLRQRIEVTSADASSVKLTCGAVLKPDSGFAPISTRENMAVYNLTGNQVPLNGPKASMKYASKRRGNKKSTTGGSRPSYALGGYNGGSGALHAKFMAQTTDEIKNTGRTSRLASVCISYLQSLMRGEGTQDKVLELFNGGRISRSPVATYFTALDPLNQSVDKVHFQKWSEVAKALNYTGVTEDADIYVSYQKMYKAIQSAAAKHGSHVDGLDDLREQIQDSVMNESIPKKRIPMIHNGYKAVWEKMGGSGNVITELTRHDEMTFICGALMFQTLEEDNTGKAEIFDTLKNYYSRSANASSESDLQIFNSTMYSGGRFDPAGTISSLDLASRSDCLFGGPRVGKGRGSENPEDMEHPAGMAAGTLINIGAISEKLYSEASSLMIGGLGELLAQIKGGSKI